MGMIKVNMKKYLVFIFSANFFVFSGSTLTESDDGDDQGKYEKVLTNMDILEQNGLLTKVKEKVGLYKPSDVEDENVEDLDEKKKKVSILCFFIKILMLIPRLLRRRNANYRLKRSIITISNFGV